jgi:hypothetical protein
MKRISIILATTLLSSTLAFAAHVGVSANLGGLGGSTGTGASVSANAGLGNNSGANVNANINTNTTTNTVGANVNANVNADDADVAIDTVGTVNVGATIGVDDDDDTANVKAGARLMEHKCSKRTARGKCRI